MNIIEVEDFFPSKIITELVSIVNGNGLYEYEMKSPRSPRSWAIAQGLAPGRRPVWGPPAEIFSINQRKPSSWKNRTLGSRSQLDLENTLIETTIQEYCTSIIQPTVDFPIQFTSATIWKDEPGFFMAPHKDNFGVCIAMQIYLNNNNCPGTLFEMDDSTKFIKYGYNRGYILHNYIRPRISHSVPNHINSESRASVYILFHKLDENNIRIQEENEQKHWARIWPRWLRSSK